MMQGTVKQGDGFFNVRSFQVSDGTVVHVDNSIGLFKIGDGS